MFAIYAILAVILSVVIEAARIKATYGQVQNISKVVSFTIGAVLFGACLALIYSGNYYYNPTVLEISIFALFYASVRGVLYDPLLNLLRGKEISYTSTTTNSIIDFIERVGLKWGFWTERVVYLSTALVLAFLYTALSTRMNL